MVRMAEGLSSRTCEECGSPGTQNDESWISTLCDSCRKNIMEIRKRSVEEAQQRVGETHKSVFQRLADDEEDNDWDVNSTGEQKS